jgi:mannose-6-phosphate isomerase-like protein (cupin superfamily)
MTAEPSDVQNNRSFTSGERRYRVAQLDAIPPIDCPCGQTRRAFLGEDNPVASAHLVDISTASRPHFHQRMTEIYIVLEGEGHMELDDEVVPLKPLTAILIKPGCCHRAVGRLRIVNVPVPAFDPADEYF